jgi:hypothetical protein
MRSNVATIQASGSRSARSGAALIVVIVAIAIMTGLAHSLSLTIVRRHQRIERELDRAQTRWLAESALLRAQLIRRQDPLWAGETWSPVLPRPGFRADQTASVVIQSLSANEPGSNQVRVSAELTFGPAKSSKVNRVVTLASEHSADRPEDRP